MSYGVWVLILALVLVKPTRAQTDLKPQARNPRFPGSFTTCQIPAAAARVPFHFRCLRSQLASLRVVCRLLARSLPSQGGTCPAKAHAAIPFCSDPWNPLHPPACGFAFLASTFP
jgi:hypothetical protein